MVKVTWEELPPPEDPFWSRKPIVSAPVSRPSTETSPNDTDGTGPSNREGADLYERLPTEAAQSPSSHSTSPANAEIQSPSPPSEGMVSYGDDADGLDEGSDDLGSSTT
jgi:hypothetical protein